MIQKKLQISIQFNTPWMSPALHDLIAWGQDHESLTIIPQLIPSDSSKLSLCSRLLNASIYYLEWIKLKLSGNAIRLNLLNHNNTESEFDLVVLVRSNLMDLAPSANARLGTIACVSCGNTEVIRKQVSTTFSVYHLKSVSEKNILFHGKFVTRPTILLNTTRVLESGIFYLKKLLKDVSELGIIPDGRPAQEFPPPLPISLTEQLMHVKSLIPKHHSRTHTLPNWGVAFSRTPWKEIEMSKGIKIENPPHAFLADPFVITENGKDYCFVEEFDGIINRGKISVYQLHESSATRLGCALAEPFHLSFPYLFRYDSKIFMVPESAQNSDIRVYEAINFPLEWKLKQVIMSNISTVDTIIFQLQSRWWLFTNPNPLGFGDHNSELSIFYADNPFSTDWTAHAQNPIIIDPTRSRNGGILYDQVEIFRVAQKQGYKQYGQGFGIYKITKLTPEEYEEVEISRVEPDFFEGLIGTHHFHNDNKLTVFDFLHAGHNRYAK